ncbi:hypothetical protein NJF54_20140 [Pseudomonas guariconensis]|uniref:hypothetical protein n=1 Tax=Pseudomonas guariconensis TaxID=1288410 RepID=UPI00209B3753|nr:hypothetical protein [Pseudomonas guariconensis]MCO7634136.1 hypothetical protein [Pseudomonas guariconensis]
MKHLLTVDHLYRATETGLAGATLTIPLLLDGVVVDEVRVSGKTESTYQRTVEVPAGAIAGPHTCDGLVCFTFKPAE